MNIRLLRICSVPIRISSPELHVSVECFLHELHKMEQYVTTTYRSDELHICVYKMDTYLVRIFNIELMR